MEFQGQGLYSFKPFGVYIVKLSLRKTINLHSYQQWECNV